MLTVANQSGYHFCVAETKATRIGVLKIAAMSRSAASNVAFLSSGAPFNGRLGGRSRKARRCDPGTPTPFSAAHPIGVGRAVHNLNRRSPTMQTHSRFDDAALRIECAKSLSAVLSIINNPDGGRPSDSVLSLVAHASSLLLSDAISLLENGDD